MCAREASLVPRRGEVLRRVLRGALFTCLCFSSRKTRQSRLPSSSAVTHSSVEKTFNVYQDQIKKQIRETHFSFFFKLVNKESKTHLIQDGFSVIKRAFHNVVIVHEQATLVFTFCVIINLKIEKVCFFFILFLKFIVYHCNVVLIKSYVFE